MAPQTPKNPPQTVDTSVASPPIGLAPIAYALFCYACTHLGLGTFILYVNDVLLPFGVNDPATLAWPAALAINVGLIVGWGLQHSVMARGRFKRWWTSIIPAYTERATYCLASAIALFAVCALFQPLPGMAWALQGDAVRVGLTALGLSGWVLLLLASFEIDHFELFGLRQAFDARAGRRPAPATFKAGPIYARVRHPIQTGLLFGMWLTPTMSMTRLVFASLMTIYVLVGLYFEERDLVRSFGQRYVAYMAAVPRLLPRLSAARLDADPKQESVTTAVPTPVSTAPSPGSAG